MTQPVSEIPPGIVISPLDQLPSGETASAAMVIAKAATRPVLALSSMGLFIGAFFTGRIEEMPTWLSALGATTILWWFGERTLQDIFGRLAR